MESLQSTRTALGHWVRDLSPTCRDATRLQSRALDGALPRRARVGLKLHLMVCQWCRRYGQQIRFLREAVRHVAEELAACAEIKLPAEARERLKASVQRCSDECGGGEGPAE